MAMDEMEDDNNQQIADFETAQPASDSGNVETADFELFDGKDDDFATMLMSKGTDLSGCLLGIKARKWEHIFSLYKNIRNSRALWQHHHRSERKITEAEGELIKAMTEAHVPPSVQFRVAAAGAGGDAFVGHTKRDHINYVNRLKMKSIKGGDAATLINLMTSRQAEEPGFFFRVQFDEKGRLSNLFWRDAMMRDDYLLYGDVKIFDTTYRTNRYNLICGAFVGIKNHWSNVMFGCAFLSNEKEESFEWLFNVFNESIGEDIRPVSIFTGQDQAITNAIETVYPQTRHRLCQWHIQQNAISHFGKLKDYGLVNHSWFKRLYKHIAKWSTAFNNQFFSAGFLSSQRSESTNHAMDFQASKTTSVTEFFGIFENTVKRWRGEEERKEFDGIISTPYSVYPLVDLLLHASQVYTLELFRVFEKEFALAIGTRAVILPIDDPEVLLYRVYPAGHEEDNHHVT
ncbi:protein FAR1-RELATED SEQUENCE 5-like [Silene latifolia]|uniref:protein FAR1-RELATED SEQUENCE 5-like n=1 Tax=Silene latifolia TaxID=37657 RepID=UPI003D76FF64